MIVYEKRRKLSQTETHRGKGHEMVEAKLGGMLSQAKELLKSSTVWDSQGRIFFLESLEGALSCQHLEFGVLAFRTARE